MHHKPFGAQAPPRRITNKLSILLGMNSKYAALTPSLCFSSDFCSAPNFWRTSNQRHWFTIDTGWMTLTKCWSWFASRPTIWIALCKYGQLILGKILKVIATRWHILRVICIKFNFGWCSAPGPTGVPTFSTPPDLLAGFGGPTSKASELEGRKGGERKRDCNGGERREGRRGEWG